MEYEEKMKEKGETPVMFSHLGPVRRRTTAEEEERVKHPMPEDSVYYHPTLNPSGAPPPGKPPMFKSSIGPRIPLPESSGNVASSSQSEADDTTLPLPPPPPPLPGAGLDSVDGASLPLPPPPPMPPILAVGDITSSSSPPPLPPPPPPPGPPPKELLAVRPPLPPPPPIQPSTQPPPPGTAIGENAKSEDSTSRHPVQLPTSLPPQPPPIGMPTKSGDTQPESSSSNSEAKIPLDPKDLLKMAPPPPPLRQHPHMPGVAIGHPDVPPPGISRFPHPPPPPPADMRPPLPSPGLPGQPIHPGLMAPPLMPRPPFGPPLTHPSMMRPPLPPGPPPFQQDEFIARQAPPQKPSYIKSAASTVVKRPLAQHTPELTAMVPASVRVRRESALPKPKPKTATLPTPNRPIVAPPVAKKESTGLSSASKPPSIDDSYMAFLEDMKALGALDS